MKKKMGDIWQEPSKSGVVSGYRLTTKDTNISTYIVGASKEQIVMLKAMYNPKTFKWKKVKIQEVK